MLKPNIPITLLYRVENPNIPARPNGETSHEELIGQWFSPNLVTAMKYMRKATQTFGKDAAPVDGAQLVVAEVPTDQLEDFHVTKHPVAATMDVESDNYIVRRDGSIPTITVELDDVVGDLRGRLRNITICREAQQRVITKLGELSIL